MERGRFIVIEGIDGAGTTTQVELLTARFACEGKNVVQTREPTNGVFGELIRGVLKHEIAMDARSLALAFAADRERRLMSIPSA